MVSAKDFVNIDFTAQEQEYIQAAGIVRHIGATIIYKRNPYLYTKERNGRIVDAIGLAGEAAVLKFLGYPIPLVQVQIGLDGGADVLLSNGQTIDAKITTDRERNCNLVIRKPDEMASFYVLMWPREDFGVTVIGCISRERVRDFWEPMPTGIGNRVKWQLLAPIEKLRRWIEANNLTVIDPKSLGII